MQNELVDSINELIQGPINWLFKTDAYVMFPIIIIILGLIFRQSLSKSIRSGILIGIGFIGIFTFVNDVFIAQVGPATEAFVDNTGIDLIALDAGWSLASTITWAMPTAFGVIIVCFLVNLIMLALGNKTLTVAGRTIRLGTMTLDVDLWNYWAFGFTAALTYVVTEPYLDVAPAYLLAMLFAVIHAIMAFKISDWIAPCMADPENFNLPGISLPHGNAMMAPYAFGIDKVLKKIPGIGSVKADPESVQEKLGLIGEPIFIGLVIGGLIGILGYYPEIESNFWGNDINDGFLLLVTRVAMTSAAVMYLIPKMVAVLMEGLIPLSEGIRDYITQRYPGREFIIGMDMAIIVGYPAVIAVALIMIPISIFIALLLSNLPTPFGIIVLPYADLAGMVFYSVLAVMPSKGNLVRGVLSGTIQLVVILYTAGIMAPLMTAAGEMASFEGFEGLTITSLDAGSNTVHWMLILLIFPFFQMEAWTKIFDSGGYWIWFVIDIAWWVGYVWLWHYLRDEPTRISEEKIHDTGIA
ncbi:MAG: PTS transporter subunit IIC [Candidatus Hodarchaeales archaeon]|jgi:PTS system galactitol-specific IIC component